MKKKPGRREISGLPRRKFMAHGCAACAGAALAAPKVVNAKKSPHKLRLRVIYAVTDLVQQKPDWPNLGFEFAPVMEKYNTALDAAFPEIEFLPVTSKGPNQAAKILLKDATQNIDGYIVIQLNGWNLSISNIVASGKPVLFVDFKYGGSGAFLVYSSLAQRTHAKNLGFVSSCKMEDLMAAIKCFGTANRPCDFGEAVAQTRRERTPGPGDLSCAPDPVDLVSTDEAIRKMKDSKILAVGYPGVSAFAIPFIPVKMISFAKLDRAYQEADRDEAREIAAGWKNSASLIKDVSDQTLEDSAAMHLGMKKLMQKYRANAITVNCLVGFYNGRLGAYPCMGFYDMSNNGLVGACECDVRSAATMLAINALTSQRPGYISDPVLETSTRRIIYAHCVASNRPFGPSGPANPIEILTHSEDRMGAAVRSLMPAGYMTTTIEIMPERRQILMHQAKTTGNDPDDRACRTKLIAEPVGDFEKLFTMWDKWGWHRVTAYGDLKESIAALADAMRYKVVEEA